MRKKVAFTVSLVITTCLLSGCIILIYNFLQKPKEEYTISSFIRVENKKEVITESCFDLADCLNAEDEMELKISAGANEERRVKYEICFLVGYEQVPFQIEKKKFTSYLFENSSNVTVQIKKKYFDRKNNSFIILLRQDIERYAESSELIRDTPPVILRYSVIKKSANKKSSRK